ncbi:MAG: YciI family protein [Terriglobales bacterium]
MKFVCLGYFDDTKWEALSETERKAFMEECFAYDDVLCKGGHIVGGEALEAPRNTATLRLNKGKVIVTDGPYAETKEQVGGILILEARDRKHAIELISKHPGLRGGPWEIRARDESINAAFEARNHGRKEA